MSDTVLVAIITGLSLVTAATLPLQISTHRKAKSAASSAASANEQVTNSHKTNLREEGDSRHREIMTKLGTIDDRLTIVEQLPTVLEETQDRTKGKK